MARASAKRTVSEHKLSNVHAGHENHLCELVAKRKMAQVAELAAGAKYLCSICGRAAASAASLCEPVEIRVRP